MLRAALQTVAPFVSGIGAGGSGPTGSAPPVPLGQPSGAEPEGLKKTQPLKIFPEHAAIKAALTTVNAVQHSALSKAFSAVSLEDGKPDVRRRITAEAPLAIGILQKLNSDAEALEPLWDGKQKIRLLRADWHAVNPKRPLVPTECDITFKTKSEVYGGMWAMSGEPLGNTGFIGRYNPPPQSTPPFAFLQHDHEAAALRRSNEAIEADSGDLEPTGVAEGAKKVFQFEIKHLTNAV